MTDKQKEQLGLMLGMVVGSCLGMGFTPQQVADAFAIKNVMKAAEILNMEPK